MPRTRIKICGITRPEDAQRAADLGADAIGLNFVGGPRKVSTATAGDIIANVGPFPFLLLVGLIGPDTRIENASSDAYDYECFVYDSMHFFQKYQLTFVHCAPGERAVSNVIAKDSWPVYPVCCRADIKDLRAYHAREYLRPGIPSALLLDTASAEKLGGTGQAFNWHWIAEARAAGELDGLPPIILAGGLTPDNVADAIRIARTYAVDVSSGVEIPNQPGIKDPLKIRDFIQAVRSTDT